MTNWLMKASSSLRCKVVEKPVSYLAFISLMLFNTYSKSIIDTPLSLLLVMLALVGAPATSVPLNTDAYVKIVESLMMATIRLHAEKKTVARDVKGNNEKSGSNFGRGAFINRFCNQPPNECAFRKFPD